MAIDKNFIDDLVAQVNIVDVISNYVSLKRSGSNYMGLCPFHSEKSPSFSVSESKQFYHCFGCNSGGGVINFIMNIEGLSYVDAIRFLAKMYNIEVVENNEFAKYDSSDRDKILGMNKKTARFFYNNLQDEKNAHIKEYLKDRKISPKIATTFGIGYANNSFNDLMNYLEKEGYTKDDMILAGLVSRNDKGSVYDKFRARVMFPIIDVRGDVIAFGGRVIDDSMPKYLNSPETKVFIKSNNLFALNIAKKSKMGYIILAEGYMDVIALHMAGFDCAVASLGTSLTDGQARILTKYTNDVVIAFDSDNAGQIASNRAIDILKKVGLNIKVLQMNDAKDPDEFIKKHGKTRFENLIDSSDNDTQYKFDKILSRYNLADDTQKIDCIKELIKMISELPSAIERDIFLTKSSQKTDVSIESIRLEFKNYVKNLQKNLKSKQKRETLSPSRFVQPKFKEITYENVKSARAEEEILCLLFTDCNLIGKIDINDNRFSVDFFRNVYNLARGLYEDGKQITISSLTDKFDANEISHLTKIINRPQTTVNREELLRNCIDKINEQYAYRTDDLALLMELKKKSRSV
ncbi:MAG: DNA primase [Clostridia bacterium]